MTFIHVPLGVDLTTIHEHMAKYDGELDYRFYADLPDDDHNCAAHGPKFPKDTVAEYLVISTKKVDVEQEMG